ncbi:MAG: carboxypeptidase regulatory-like domain-containing protein [Bacteroidia bacterium]
MKNVFLFFMLTSTLIGVGVMMKPVDPAAIKGVVLAGTESVWVARVDLLDSNLHLISSTLSDEKGNFSFDSLTPGKYFLQVSHASFVSPSTNSVQIGDGEQKKLNIVLSPLIPEPTHVDKVGEVPDGKGLRSHERGKAAVRGEMLSEPEGDYYSDPAVPSDPDYESGGKPSPGIGPGTLTAGEINDYSKWVLWEDLTQTSFDAFQTQWGFYLKNRYPVQVTFENGVPIVDAEVRLLSNKNEVVYLARTDNTGKAELWADMVPEVKERMARRYKAVVKYKGVEYTFPRLDAYPNGINTLSLKGKCETSAILDIAFVVDATGSMGDEINYLKTELADVINRVKAQNEHLNLRTASVFYRDHGDQYLTRQSDFSPSVSTTLDFIQNQYAAGGGDFPEAVDEALDAALNRLSWSKEARGRILFLVLDAPPHQADSVVKRLHQLIYKAAAMGVRIIPITASGINKDVEYLMRSMALATNGTYVFLTDHSGVGNKHLEPSTDSYEVQKLNDLMVNLINRYATVTECDQQIPDQPLTDSTQKQVQILTDSANKVYENLKLTCFPVPTTGPITFDVSHAGGVIYVFDSNGKLVLRFEMTERSRLKTDLVQLASGFYFVRYEIQGKWVSEKIVLRSS